MDRFVTNSLPFYHGFFMSDKSNIRAGSIERVTPSNKQGIFLLKIDFDSVIGSKNTFLLNLPTLLPESLLEKHVCAIINLPFNNQGSTAFDTIVLCMPDSKSYYIPIRPDYSIPNGGSLF